MDFPASLPAADALAAEASKARASSNKRVITMSPFHA
jgi:hypothetical protein